jgi:CSLREA domain-containing protein
MGTRSSKAVPSGIFGYRGAHAPYVRLKRLTLSLLALGASFSIFSPSAQANPDCLPAPSGMVAWWPGDGDATDQVAGRDATAVGGATFTTGSGGKVGEAFSLDGVDDYFNIPHDSAFNLSSAITIEAWVLAPDFADDPDNFSPIVAKGDSAWRMQRHSNSDNAAFGTSGLSNVDQVGNDVIDGGAWHHIAATFSDATDTKTLYVDGAVDAQDAATTGSISTNGQPVRIGNNSEVTTRFWGGLIDEVTLYNRALSAAEIAALHAADSDGKCKTATTLTPTRFDDPSPDTCLPTDCSLREAVIAANANSGMDTIEVPAGSYSLTRAGAEEDAASTGDLDITDSVTITGAGQSTTSIDGGDLDRVFHVLSGTTVDISGVTIRNGTGNATSSADPTNGWGGGIYNAGSLTLTDTIVTQNVAENDDPDTGQGRGGGIYNNAGTLELDGSSVTDNTAPTTTGLSGGIFSVGGTLTLTDSEVSGNSAGSQVAGIEADNTAFTITGSTISGNNVIDGGATLAAGISAEGGSFSVTNSTVSGNFVTSGSAFAGGIFYRDMSPTITNSTIANNTGTSGAIHRGTGPDVDATNVLVSGNSSPECNAAVTSVADNNLEEGAACFTAGDLQNAFANLDALAYNGGPTRTHALGVNSDAIDAGDNGECPSVDQRGAARTDGACDIGSFEADAGVTLVVNTTDDLNDGSCTPSHCSLREAILASNAVSGADTIEFDIPGSGPFTISPTSQLPTITDPVTIDGYSEDGAAPASNPAATIMIHLDGTSAGSGSEGLDITASDSTIKGLSITSFIGNGIEIRAGATGNVIEGNYIGLDPDGSTDLGNGSAGVYIVSGASNNVIGGTAVLARNVISGNDSAFGGVRIEGGTTTGNTVAGNYIGTNAAGDTSVANFVGIDIRNSSGNSIGNGASGGGNLISGNLHHGIDMIDDDAAGTATATTNNLVLGNLIGTTADGTSSLGNGTTTNANGISMNGIASNTVGGDSADERNVISGNGASGIRLNNQAQNNTIQGNYIGTTADGQSALGNGEGGVSLSGTNLSDNTIGGIASGVGNVISANTANGILLNSSGGQDNLILGNKIGVAADGTTDLGNGQHGVSILNGTDATVGGTASGAGNTIAYNAGDGARIDTGTSHGVSGNSIFSNGDLGIDLLNDGVTANDVDDPDTGPNNLQNFPIIEDVDTSASTTVEGSLNSTPSTTFDLDFYYSSECDGSGNGEGETYLGTIEDQTTDANGDLDYSHTFTTTVPDGEFVTATATGPDGTSEFSDCAQVGPHVVNSTDDDSDDDTTDTVCDTGGTVGSDPECTLRAAIEQANATSGADEIEFDIPSADLGCTGTTFGEEVCTIAPASAALPTISDSVTIDGYTQTGAGQTTAFVPADLKIEIDGTSAVAASSGLRIESADSTVRGLVINDFGFGHGILITGSAATGNVIEGNYIGTDVTGQVDRGNAGRGILVDQGDATIGGTSTSDRNIISGNTAAGIEISSSSSTAVQGNYIGLGSDGSTDLGNGGAGVTTDVSNVSTTIGGTAAGARNVISGNDGSGVVLSGDDTGTLVQGNYIGTDAAGTADRGNTLNGIHIDDGTAATTIGGTAAGARNVISGNGAAGIFIDGSGTESNVIQGNYIGVNASGNHSPNAVGNSDVGVLVQSSEDTQIGGSAAGAGNVISGNGTGGISASHAGAMSGTVVEGNSIGTNAAGTSVIANGGDGVALADLDSNNVVKDNVISGNTGDGVELPSGLPNGTGNTIEGNLVGVGSNGTTAMGNSGAGITVGAQTPINVGGTDPGEANTVANNGLDGVAIELFSGKTVRGNSIFSNGGLGIDLVGGTEDANGVTANDTDDPDTGSNNLQNFPVITFAQSSSNNVQGTLNSTALTTFDVDFYSSAACDGSGNGEGATYLDSTQVTTNASGDATFNLNLAASLTPGNVLTATATDPAGNTSEFSACQTVSSPPPSGGGPPPDTDADGIPQDQDACPFVAEDFDGFEDNDGCPEADNDQDGIEDVDDACPNQPEDFDGFEDNDGCPEPGPGPDPGGQPALAECQANPAAKCGTDGDDNVTVGNGETWYLGAGNDVVTVTGCDNVIFLQGGNDVVLVLNPNCPNVIFLGDGDDSLSTGGATARSSESTGSVGGLTVNGEAGNDSIRGGGLGDALRGGLGNDFVAGLGGNDVLKGGGGPDKLRGGAGNDTLIGGASNDSCKGGPGQNKLKSCES